MESGLKYVVSKQGLVKFIVIAFGCVTFAMLADTGYHMSARMKWVFAAFIVSFAVSVLFYVFRVSGLANKLGTCGPCTFDGFDFLWSWFSSIWCLAAAISFALVFPKSNSFNRWYNELITAVVFAFLTGITYAIEAYILKDRAPANIGYIATRKGWLKTLIIAFGAATFGMMVDSGYSWCARGSGCYIGITYALVAFIVGWAVTVIIWILHMSGVLPSNHHDNFGKFEFFWSVACVLLFWSAGSCFAAFLGCHGQQIDRYRHCHLRLASVICGFATGILYIIDAILLRP